MYTAKIFTLASLLMFSRYDASGGCVANYAQGPADLNPDAGSALQVSPNRISVSTGALIQITAGSERAGQSVQLKQGNVELPLGVLDAQGSLQKQLTKTDLTPFSLGVAQATLTSGPQATVRFFIEPKLDNAPTPFAIGPVSKAGPTPVWVGVAQKRIITLNFRDATGTGIIRQAIGEYFLDKNGTINLPQIQNYQSYAGSVFPENYYDQGSRIKYSSTGIGLTSLRFFVSEFDAIGSQSIFISCPLDSGCNGMLTARPYTRITSMTSFIDGSLFAAIVTAGGTPALRAFRDGTLGTAVDIVGGNTALPHETMVGVGRLSEDDLVDLIAVSPTGGVSVWLGGQGGLMVSDAMATAVQQALAGAGVAVPSALTVGDLDGDGLDDLVVASNAQVVMLINQGGRFAVVSGPTVPAGLSPVTSLAVGDVSVAGRGIPDLVLASKDQHSIGAIENSATY